MKARIKYSRYVNVVTTIILSVMVVVCLMTFDEKPIFYTMLFLLSVLIVTALFWGPLYIEADKDYVIMGSLLRRHKILVRDIDSVELFQPTMGAIRIFASGGFMGYWGIFRESDIGRYYAFYGKASDCFLIRMKNGHKYLLGCSNPSAMVQYIYTLITEPVI